MASEPDVNARPAPSSLAGPVLWAQPQPQEQSSTPWEWLAGLTLLATVFRVIGLNQQLWYDEMITLVEFVRLPVGEIVTTYTSQNQHMLYSLLARLSVVSFGESPWALRLPAVLFGVLCVPALYFCARLWTGRREALFACALLTVSYHHVWFSQNARGYTGLAFFTLLSTYFFFRGAEERGWRWWMAYALAVAAGMYTHLSLGFIVVGQGIVYLWMLAARRREIGRWPENACKPLVGFLLAALFSALLYAPVMGDMLHRTVGEGTARGAPEVARAEWRSPLWFLKETLRGLAGGSGALGLAALAAGGLLLLAGVVRLWRVNRFAVGFIFAPILVTAAVTLALSRNLWPRFFFFAIGFGMLLLVCGVGELCRLGARARWGFAAVANRPEVLLLVLLLAFAWQMRAAWIYPKQDYKGAMAFVEERRGSGDAVVLAGLTVLPYQKYYGRRWPAVESPEQLAEVRARSENVWVLYTIPIYIQSRFPALWNILQQECKTEKVFRGTMGGGEVFVCRLPANSSR